MPEPRPGEQPGHLDIDVVSAFVDRDLEIAELTILEQHLHECPACEREVLEIRATVLLLNTLPRYEPRRSFCLGQEHARAHRRRDRQQPAYPPGSNPLTLPASTPPPPVTAPAYARWMPALQVATLVTGVLLLLVTVGDLSGMLDSQPAPMQLAAPVAQDAAPEAPMAAAPQDSLDQEQESAPIPLLTATAGPAAAMPRAAAPQEAAGFAQGGTNSTDDASDQLSESDDAVRTAARAIPTNAAAAAVTQAIPTPGVENPAVSTSATGNESTISNDRPSLVRIVQIGLGALLLWLIVSMAGVQWIRRLR